MPEFGVLLLQHFIDFFGRLDGFVELKDFEFVGFSHLPFTLQDLGFGNAVSLKTGLRGWNEYDLPLVDGEGHEIDPENGDLIFATNLREDQKRPAS